MEEKVHRIFQRWQHWGYVWGKESIRFPVGEKLATKMEKEERSNGCGGSVGQPYCMPSFFTYLVSFYPKITLQNRYSHHHFIDEHIKYQKMR